MHSQDYGNEERPDLISEIDETFKQTNRLLDKIYDLMERLKKPLNSIETKIIMVDLFNQHFNLKEDTIEETLIGPAIYKRSREFFRPQRLVKLVNAYSDHQIGQIYKISVIEFFNLTFHEIQVLIEGARRVLETKKEITDEILEENADLLGMGDN